MMINERRILAVVVVAAGMLNARVGKLLTSGGRWRDLYNIVSNVGN